MSCMFLVEQGAGGALFDQLASMISLHWDSSLVMPLLKLNVGGLERALIVISTNIGNGYVERAI